MAAWDAQIDALRDASVAVVAVSTDPADKAAETVARLGLRFPVGFGLPREETAARLGIFHEERRGILHAAAFLVGEDGVVQVGVASTGAVGRLMPDETLGLVRFWDRER